MVSCEICTDSNAENFLKMSMDNIANLNTENNQSGEGFVKEGKGYMLPYQSGDGQGKFRKLADMAKEV